MRGEARRGRWLRRVFRATGVTPPPEDPPPAIPGVPEPPVVMSTDPGGEARRAWATAQNRLCTCGDPAMAHEPVFPFTCKRVGCDCWHWTPTDGPAGVPGDPA